MQKNQDKEQWSLYKTSIELNELSLKALEKIKKNNNKTKKRITHEKSN